MMMCPFILRIILATIKKSVVKVMKIFNIFATAYIPL